MFLRPFFALESVFLLVVITINITAGKETVKSSKLQESKLTVPAEEARQYGSGPVKYLISSLSQNSNPYTKVSYSPPPLPTTTASSYISITSNNPSISLGDSCTGYSDCTSIKGATCQLNICACGPGTVSLSNIACIPVAKFLGDQCVITAQCRQLDPLAVCYKDTCLCEPIYHVAGDAGGGGGHSSYGVDAAGAGAQGQRASLSCIRKQKLGEVCTDNVQCAYQVWNSVCDARTRSCSCAAGFVAIGNTQCAPVATSLGQPCSVHAQCASIMFADCGRSGTCECPDATRFVQVQAAGDRRKRQAMHGGYGMQMCVEAQHLGHTCMVGAQCSKKTKNSDCISGTCRCVDGYVARDPNINECLPKIMAIGLSSRPCTISAQCMLTGTFCNQTIDRCDCTQLFCALGGECLPMVGHELPCRDSCQCTTIGATCLNGWCQCKQFSTFSQLINMCLPQSLQLSSDVYEFTAPCCGDTRRSRCVGQVTIDPSSNVTGPFLFSLTSTTSQPQFSIDGNGGILISGTPALTMPVTLTVTVANAAGLVDTALALIKPGACCTIAPTATSSVTSRAVSFITTVNDPAQERCTTTLAAADVTGVIINSMPVTVADLFSMPCGELTAITGSATITLTSAGATSTLVCTSMNGFLGVTGTLEKIDAATPATATCTYTLTATGCNGLSSVLTYTVAYTCP